MGMTEPGLDRADPRRLHAARPADLLHRGPEGSARVDGRASARPRRRRRASSTPTSRSGFIRAEVIAFDDFVALQGRAGREGSRHDAARRQGLRRQGRRRHALPVQRLSAERMRCVAAAASASSRASGCVARRRVRAASCATFGPRIDAADGHRQRRRARAPRRLRRARSSRAVTLTNPNEREVAVDALDATLSIEGEPVGDGARSSTPVTLPANGTADAQIVARTGVDAILRAVAARHATPRHTGSAGFGAAPRCATSLDGTARARGRLGDAVPAQRRARLAAAQSRDDARSRSPRCRASATTSSCSTATRQPFDARRRRRSARSPIAASASAATRCSSSSAARRADADFRYRIFNADGGEVEQCGNGARCFVRVRARQGPHRASARSASRPPAGSSVRRSRRTAA